jgi:fumarate reductase subunit C
MTMVRRPYVRPMQGWWMRDRWFMRYMAREATAVFVVAYALILLVTVLRLREGRDSFDAWVAILTSGPAIAFHGLLLAAFLWHTITWFAIMPKTMPPVIVGGHQLAPGMITAAGLAASAVVTALVIGVARVLAA